MATSALAVKSALKAEIDSVETDGNLEVTWGFPKKEPAKRWCIVGDIKWDTSEWITNRGKNESYKIVVDVWVRITGGTAQEAETQAEAYESLIEDALKANPKVGVSNVITSSFIPVELQSWPQDDGGEARFKCEFAVTARI